MAKQQNSPPPVVTLKPSEIQSLTSILLHQQKLLDQQQLMLFKQENEIAELKRMISRLSLSPPASNPIKLVRSNNRRRLDKLEQEKAKDALYFQPE